MLYVIYGTDSRKTRQKLGELTDALLKKRPDASMTKITPESWSIGFFNEALSGAGLFAPKNIVVLDSLVSHKDSQDFILENIGDIGSSEHVCIIIEGKLTKELLKKIEKKAEKVSEYNLPEGASDNKKRMPETFAFAEAVAMGDKKKAWMVYQHLMQDGLAAEEIHGVLWWQFKSIKLASQFGDAKTAGLNPYVYQKSRGLLRNWEGQRLDAMLGRLISVYHHAHRGELDFKAELELLCLE